MGLGLQEFGGLGFAGFRAQGLGFRKFRVKGLRSFGGLGEGFVEGPRFLLRFDKQTDRSTFETICGNLDSRVRRHTRSVHH